ncbi:CopG family ribbon-helix-helix protein [Negadavirga shengliensis]|uniref:CopG family ribbon-helix-helix protein n=1 Tax=Negadavirga shengliensis TaxID=1389218 RepID=A0ABV9SXK4_9BACT
MFTIRLDPELKAKLYALSREKGISQSAVVKEALAMYFKRETASASPYELGEDLFGQVSGGSADGSRTYKKVLKDRLHGKHSH